MRFRQPHSLPGLLTLLAAEPPYPGSGRWGMSQPLGQLRQVIRLAREGLLEYGRRLDALEKQVAQTPWDRDDDPSDLPSVGRGRADDDVKVIYRPPAEISCELEEPRLTQRQIHHLFEKLAIHRYSLNGREYPYTSDVNDERQRVYPSTELLTRGDVEEAWDDWRNDDGKRLFRGYYSDTDLDETEQRRKRRDENQDERYRDRGNGNKNQTDDLGLSRLSQEKFAAIFRALYRDRVGLNRWGYPYIADVQEEQKAMFGDTRVATSAETERAFESWDGRVAYRRRARRDDSEIGGRNHHANGRDHSSEGHGSRAGRGSFRVFDEMLRGGEYRSSDFSKENLPRMRAVNRRLLSQGEPRLENEEALQREWREYLVIAAKAREEQLRDRDQLHESREERENPHSEMSVEVDLNNAVLGKTEEMATPFEERGNGRKRKHE